MIIYLKGAKFSSNNIGTLNTWLIQQSISRGASSSNTAKTVTKGDAYSTTITINEGYELGAAGITVTMGGTDITSTAVSGLTISIASVTGNVKISVPTVNTATGEEDETNYTFTITPNPISATVTLSATGYSTVSGTGSKSITVANGTKVNWSVSANGYTTRTGNWTISGGNKTENITLSTSSGGESGIINYFNPDDPDINETHYMNHEGAMTEGGETLGWSGYIACSPGETYYAYYNKDGTYTKYPSSMVTFFDASKNRISGLKDDDYLVPEGAAYFKAPFSKARRYNDFMFIKSPNVPTTFIPYNAG